MSFLNYVCAYLFLGSFCSFSNTTFANYAPDTCVIVFDIDDVLIKRPQTIKALIWEHRWQIVRSFLHPLLTYQVLRLAYNQASVNAFIEQMKKFNIGLEQLVEDVTHTKQPIPGMQECLQLLKNNGYSLAIASNMDSGDYAHYTKKYPEIFDLFTYAKVIHYEGDGTKLTTPRKPSPDYFKNLRKELIQHNLEKPHSIFIDDKYKNIAASINEGFVGIQFESPAQLKAELAKLGVIQEALATA